VGTLIAIPTYQEAGNVVGVIRRIRNVVPEADILVIDDASPDGTAGIAEATGREVGHVSVLRRPAKSGLGSAYRDGFAWALERGYQIVVEMDADLSHDPATLPVLLQAVARGADLALGSRYVPGGNIPRWSWHRRALSRWGNRYASWALGLDVADATSGFRAYRAETLRGIDLGSVRADGYGFQIEMAFLVVRAGGKVVEVPIQFADRTQGQSKMSSRIVIEALALVSWWGARERLRQRRLGRLAAPR
jgi:glycosyltransferase involved in cell wall biosynthesis